LGVGDSIYPARLDIESLAALIRNLISSKDVGRACRDLRDRVRQQMEREQVVRLIEEIT
jgi:UDP:flavonoid glycosyltransferase YjiC (YdhE family)